MLMDLKPDMKAPGPSSYSEYPVVCYHNFSIRKEDVIKSKNKETGVMTWSRDEIAKMKAKPHGRGLQADLVNSAKLCLNVSGKGCPRGVIGEKRRGERVFRPSIQ